MDKSRTAAIPAATRGGLVRAARVRLAVGGAALILALAVLVAALGGGGPPRLPLPGIGRPARAGDPFAYVASHSGDFVARAIAGDWHVLFVKSPGGVLATARRVAAYRGLVDSVTAGTSVDPATLEAIIFLESAGRPNVIAGSDVAEAAGLTQILAQTGQSLLGMHIDLSRSRQLTAAIDRAAARGQGAAIARLQRKRARVDDRFDPRKALAATVRYLELGEQKFGRPDLAVVSYHMGMGNLSAVLSEYDGGRAVPYPQLFFDTAPDHHSGAYRVLSGFGDDSWTYYWRVLAARRIMRLYRADPHALTRLSALQAAADSTAAVLHPPDQLHPFSTPAEVVAAYANRTILPLPSNARRLGLAYDPGMGSLAHRLDAPAALYRGLRAPALDLLIELAARVRALSGARAPLIVTSTVADTRYQRLLGVSDPPAAAGWSFAIARRYVSRGQALAFQAMLDRLQSLNLIAWVRTAQTIDVTVASDASRVIVDGP